MRREQTGLFQRKTTGEASFTQGSWSGGSSLTVTLARVGDTAMGQIREPRKPREGLCGCASGLYTEPACIRLQGNRQEARGGTEGSGSNPALRAALPDVSQPHSRRSREGKIPLRWTERLEHLSPNPATSLLTEAWESSPPLRGHLKATPPRFRVTRWSSAGGGPGESKPGVPGLLPPMGEGQKKIGTNRDVHLEDVYPLGQ